MAYTDAPQGEKEFNRRYVEYARAHGAECPNEMLARDGGLMAGFSAWIRGRWTEFARYHGVREPRLIPNADALFDAWLAARATEAKEAA